MEKPTYYAPLLALSTRLRHYGSLQAQLSDLQAQPFFRQFEPTPHTLPAAYGHLTKAQAFAGLLEQALGTEPAAVLVDWAAECVLASATVLLTATGVATLAPGVLLREMGRLVVRNALPRSLSFYATGPMGDFSVHRLPLGFYATGLHIKPEIITADTALVAALRLARYRRANEARAFVQGRAMTAIRDQKTGKVLRRFRAEHWEQLTWRLGYTTVFDLVARAQQAARHDVSTAPAPAELLGALRVVAHCCCEFLGAYLPGGPEVQFPSLSALAA